MYNEEYLKHYGVLGMKWGRRRLTQYENAAEKLRSGKVHASVGFGKRRQGAYDITDAKRFEAKAEIVKAEISRTEKKDMAKLKKQEVKEIDTAIKALKFREAHTYNTTDLGPDISKVYMDSPILMARAKRSATKVTRLLNHLNKKYDGTASVAYKKDAETGKLYVDIMLGSQTDRINID